MIKRSCEDPTILYVCLPGRRFIFREGRYYGKTLITDLCPECMDEFEKFMTAKLLEEKNAEN